MRFIAFVFMVLLDVDKSEVIRWNTFSCLDRYQAPISKYPGPLNATLPPSLMSLADPKWLHHESRTMQTSMTKGFPIG